MAKSYKLYSFDAAATPRADTPRLIFAAAGVEFEDVTMGHYSDEWAAFKPSEYTCDDDIAVHK